MALATSALIGAGLSLASGAMQASAANKATKAQTDAAHAQLALQREVYDDQTERFEPYLESGNNALGAYNYEMGLGSAPMINGQEYQGISLSPAAQFAMMQGLDGVQASAAARGGLRSGSALQALEQTRYGLAANDRENQLNRLGGMVDMGQASAGMQAQAGNAFAQMGSTSYGNMGNAQAAGAIASGNAMSGALGNLAGIFQYQKMQ